MYSPILHTPHTTLNSEHYVKFLNMKNSGSHNVQSTIHQLTKNVSIYIYIIYNTYVEWLLLIFEAGLTPLLLTFDGMNTFILHKFSFSQLCGIVLHKAPLCTVVSELLINHI